MAITQYFTGYRPLPKPSSQSQERDLYSISLHHSLGFRAHSSLHLPDNNWPLAWIVISNPTSHLSDNSFSKPGRCRLRNHYS